MDDLILYGARLNAERMVATLRHLLGVNERAACEGRPETPICIWGTHGLGKTMLVEELALELGWKFVACAPAQFEEMGDLHGLPYLENGRTVFAPPSWVPTEEGPGILLMDDLNRADERILRGLMQLFQLGKLFSWTLPAGWQIVVTANPEGGDYAVTQLDDALLTRFTHLTLSFEARAWARWAVKAGVDPRGIAFVLCYPELVNNRRTTPRTLTQFFEQIRDIPDLLAERELVYILGMSALEESTVGAFMAFLQDNLPSLPMAEDLLDAPDPAIVTERVSALVETTIKGVRRADRIGAVCTRLLLAVSDPHYTPGPTHGPNLIAFLLHPGLPHDLRMTLHRDMIREGGGRVAGLLRDPRLARLLLDG